MFDAREWELPVHIREVNVGFCSCSRGTERNCVRAHARTTACTSTHKHTHTSAQAHPQQQPQPRVQHVDFKRMARSSFVVEALAGNRELLVFQAPQTEDAHEWVSVLQALRG